MVGLYYAGADGHGFQMNLDDGSVELVDVPFGTVISPSAINNNGEITGYYYDGFLYRGFLYSGGQYSTVDAPFDPQTFPWGINDHGDIVGISGAHGFLATRQ